MHWIIAVHSSNIITKFADDTTVMGLIDGLQGWGQNTDTVVYENNLALDIKKDWGGRCGRQGAERGARPPITVDNVDFKFFWVHISEDFTCTTHMVKKAQPRLCSLRRLKKFSASPRFLRSFYNSTSESFLAGCIAAQRYCQTTVKSRWDPSAMPLHPWGLYLFFLCSFCTSMSVSLCALPALCYRGLNCCHIPTLLCRAPH